MILAMPPTWKPYGVAVLSVILALGVRLVLDPWIGLEVPFLTFFFAVLFSAWFGGLWPGLVSAVLSAILADYFFIPTVYELNFEKGTGLPLLVFAIEAVAITVLSDKSKRSEAALRASEEKTRHSEAQLRAVFSQAAVGIAVVDRTGRLVEVNQRLCEMTGRTRADLSHLTFQAITHPDDWGGTQPLIEAMFAEQGTSFEVHTRYVRPDGNIVWTEVSMSPLRDHRGGVHQLVAVVMDITERKRAMAEVVKSEERYRAFVANSSEGIWRIEIEPPIDTSLPFPEQLELVYQRARVAECNDAMSRMYGFNHAEELIGKTLEVMLPASDAESRAFLLSIAQSGYRVSEAESRERDAQGRTVYFSNSMAGIVENGFLVRVWGTQRDITERKRAERSLLESEARFKTLADSAPVLMWITDQNGACFVNRAYLDFVGARTQEEVAEFQWTNYVHPDDRTDYVGEFIRIAQTGLRFDRTFRFRRHDGVYRWMRTVALPRPAEQGQQAGYVGATFDITDNKMAEEQLAVFAQELERVVQERTSELVSSQAQLRSLAAELSLTEQRERHRIATELHDHLAQLLVLVTLKISRVKQRAGLDEHARGLLQEAEEVLNQSLTYTRTLVADLSPPVLHEFGLMAAMKWLAERMRRHHLQVKVELDGLISEERLREDQRVLLFQSVRELLMNVVKHARSGRATIAVSCWEESIRIQVKDQGQGFDPAIVSSSHSSKFGLFSIRERMKALGGNFDVTSSPGQGTTAALSLPLEKSAGCDPLALDQHPGLPGLSDSTANAEQSAASTATTGKVRVLLVDDHAMVRQGLRTLLESYPDIDVIGEAGNGEEAVALTDERHPTVVVMDVNMPRMNGVDATELIRQRHPDTIVIGLSVNADHSTRTAMRQAGAAALITKEAAVEQLHGQILDAIHGRLAADESTLDLFDSIGTGADGGNQ